MPRITAQEYLAKMHHTNVSAKNVVKPCLEGDIGRKGTMATQEKRIRQGNLRTKRD